MKHSSNKRPPVLGPLSVPPTAAGGGEHRKRGGAKNPRERTGCSNGTTKDHRIFIGTLNARTLRGEDRVCELEGALENVHWHIIGLAETRIEDTQTATLRSGNMLITGACESGSKGGVGFLVNKTIKDSIIDIHFPQTRIASLTVRFNKFDTVKIIQIYAPHSGRSDSEVEQFYQETRPDTQ